ncbi:MAG: 3-oxoacyl-[acyl-carrier-protein] reductase [Elusimicrobiota bacterium]
MDRLKGKVAIVTGGAAGIGRAIAETLAREGAKVAITDLDASQTQAAAAEIAKACSAEVVGFGGNVTDFSSCEAIVGEVIAKFGKVDVLVNNAGITKDNLLMRMSEGEWDAVLAVNLKGPFNFTKAVVRPMMKARQGRIVNIASVVGQMGNPGQANYSASKGGLIAFTKTCAKEFASRSILVNAVAPGFIDTRMTSVLPEEVKKALLSHIPLNRMGKPEEIARVVLFLASEDSSYVTGQVLAVNGGLYC